MSKDTEAGDKRGLEGDKKGPTGQPQGTVPTQP